MTDPAHLDQAHRDLDGLLSAVAGPSGAALPPIGTALRAEIDAAKPGNPRRPLSRALIVIGAAAAWALGLALMLGFRRDMGMLPQLWFALYLGAWLIAFGALSWGAQVPPRGRIMPRSALLGRLGIVVGAGFTIAGLALARHVPGLSTMPEASLSGFIRYAPYCTTVGLVTASLPLLGASLLVRGSVPIGGRWLGAAMGAASGSLGGLVLHLHCPIAERMHLGFVHGGVVVLAAAAGALLVPLLASRR